MFFYTCKLLIASHGLLKVANKKNIVTCVGISQTLGVCMNTFSSSFMSQLNTHTHSHRHTQSQSQSHKELPMWSFQQSRSLLSKTWLDESRGPPLALFLLPRRLCILLWTLEQNTHSTDCVWPESPLCRANVWLCMASGVACWLRNMKSVKCSSKTSFSTAMCMILQIPLKFKRWKLTWKDWGVEVDIMHHCFW